MTTTDRRHFLLQTTGALSVLSLVPEAALARPSVRLSGTVGLIGAGRHGRTLMAELQKIDGVKIGAICDVDEGRLQAAVRRAPGAEAFADYRAMLDRRADITAIVVATPTHLHRAPAVDSLQAGRHVYCETPLAHTIDDARAIAAAARSAKTVFASALEGRSNPVYQLARGFFRSESVRDLVSMRAHNHRKTNLRVAVPPGGDDRAANWRLDPEISLGLAGEWGVQQMDVFLWYTDRLPVRVHGWGQNRAFLDEQRRVADTIGLDFTFDDGAHLAYEATACNSYEGRYEVLHGTNAAIKLAWSNAWMFKEADAPTQGWEVYARRTQFHTDEAIILIAGATQLAQQGKLEQEGGRLPHSPQYYALADFLSCIQTGAAPAASAADGARATMMAIAANQAVRSGTAVAIDPEQLRNA
ncbi:MAG: Gfo/Idh/MocA family oxidoreductase [Phycisphaeraceae bacterium]|nr:Gfo/Idh/MocA family oxidoreductase [Phycisphaeraceae bacterium]